MVPAMKIGTLVLRNNIFLAPMAGVTNLNYRILAREFGCGLAFTEMVSANGLVRRTPKTSGYLDSALPDRPLGVQVFGADPESMAEAARIVTGRGADLVDINMGCPVRKVVKTGAGSALMGNPRRVKDILSKVRKATVLPLTVKIRAGRRPGEISAPEIGRIAEDEGVQALIIHPRTADQGFSGSADWKIIQDVKGCLKIPVIGNGDIRTAADAMRMMTETGCDGVMVGRASLGNPWIFRDILSLMQTGKRQGGPTLMERGDIIRRHLNMEMAYIGDVQGLRNFRKHLLWYTRGMKGGAPLRQLLGQIQEKEALFAILDDFFSGQTGV
jgi:tRNA-dihydrouridine synthase B